MRPMSKKTKPAKPRDPSWRLRRTLKPARIESAKSYRRAQARRTERDAREAQENDRGGDAADDAADDGGE